MADQLSSDLASLRIERAPTRSSASSSRMVSSLRSLLGWLVAAGLVGAAYWFGRPLVEAQFFRPEVMVTEVAAISPAQASVDLTSTGYVTPQRVAKIGSKLTGRVIDVRVKESAQVKAGDVLFVLDELDQKSAIASASARVAAAHARAMAARANAQEIHVQVERARRLVQAGASASSTVEDLEAREGSLLEQAKAIDAEAAASAAEVSALRVALGNLTVKAPIDGVAITKPVSTGNVVNAGESLVEIADFNSLLIEADVPEARLSMVKVGSPCEVVLESSPDRRLRGEVVEVAPKINRAKATGTVKVKLLDASPRLWPDMSARVSFLSRALDEKSLAEKPKIVIPQGAIVEQGGAKYTWVIDGDKVHLTPITVGAPVGHGLELLMGPPPGTHLVKDPPPSLSEGKAVKQRSS